MLNSVTYAIKFMLQECKSASNVYIRLQNVDDEHCASPSRVRVVEWYDILKTGRTCNDNEPRSGRPSRAIKEPTISQVDKFISGDRRLCVRGNIGAHAAYENINVLCTIAIQQGLCKMGPP